MLDKPTYDFPRIAEFLVRTVALLGSDSTAKSALPHLDDGAIKLGLPGLPVDVRRVVQSRHFSR